MMKCAKIHKKDCSKNKQIALGIFAFTAGLIASSFLPCGGIMFLLCVALILLGITFLKKDR